ncbi:MAG: hypothetical protein LBQ03_01215 [Puniceicoccales bacterium]|jgi:hypothetical protein|nr:hypothetical protein [Puniceicoccales bacterium]
MEYANMDEQLHQLERLVEEIRLQLNDLDKVLHAELETLQSQINNLRNS